jgi:hypothetical protein
LKLLMKFNNTFCSAAAQFLADGDRRPETRRGEWGDEERREERAGGMTRS